ncbi:hypothetical protein KUV85_14165 [Nocardioides panacisoli]|uniref:M57 family metalloprotease n=1 Tax=Nocardioides panacisoli TaxID=627624 RepID=UPI001C63AA06|nr:M57 family metalloprotease [Nocardioides panacisoli]QYJ03462.1 hypothetical protein KUV85_14165 [Nocardioides panacisoli]
MTTRTLLGRLAATSFVAAVAAAGALPVATAADGSGGESDVPTFKEFAASTFQDEGGQYVVNGDETIANRGELRRYYEEMTADPNETGLIVNRTYSGDDLWSASQALDLTYCVSDQFGGDKSTIVNAMAQGAALWENATSGIDFSYVPSADSNCRTSNNSVLFSVEPTSTTQYIARAFFPSSPDSQRNVLVNADSLVSSGSWTPGNIMGHELGHTLGFRHEHTRPEAGTCFEDNNWRPLTPYDSASIMHYPQCNGSSSDLSFSSYDGQGVSQVY